MRIYMSESDIKPIHIDTDSSKTLTYVHTNIQQVERDDEVSGDIRKVFTYNVAEYTKSEWVDQQLKELSSISTQQDEILLSQYEAQITQDSAIIDIYEKLGGV